jgi:hypothetical protein
MRERTGQALGGMEKKGGGELHVLRLHLLPVVFVRIYPKRG